MPCLIGAVYIHLTHFCSILFSDINGHVSHDMFPVCQHVYKNQGWRLGYSLPVLFAARVRRPRMKIGSSLILQLALLAPSFRSQFTMATQSPQTYNVEDEMYRFEPVYADAEFSGDYVRGGFHPVHLGDTFDNRYRVLRKLGFGAYSTSWLAKDERYEVL